MSRNSSSPTHNDRRMGEEDWSELPQDIIESISKRLTIYADYLRFRCVCRSWNSSVPKTPVHLPPQLPWLMLSRSSFFDLSTNKIHRLNLPRPGHICGCSHGWLVLIIKKTYELSLLNPVTHATISLPPLHIFKKLLKQLFKFYNDDNLHLIIKVVLSSSPSSLSDDDFVAFAILDHRHFVFCKKGYVSWVLLNVSKNNHTWMDAIYNNGSFYVTSTTGTIAVCDVEDSGVSFIEVLDNPFDNFNSLDSSCYTMFAGEDMLMVGRYWIYAKKKITMRFFIFKMNWNAHKWKEIQTLGEHSVFIGKNSSLYFSAADFVGCRPNCIYFTDNLNWQPEFGIYSILDKSIDPLPCYSYISKCGFGYPFWVTPNP